MSKPRRIRRPVKNLRIADANALRIAETAGFNAIYGKLCAIEFLSGWHWVVVASTCVSGELPVAVQMKLLTGYQSAGANYPTAIRDH
jgi:hypothetical protein